MGYTCRPCKAEARTGVEASSNAYPTPPTENWPQGDCEVDLCFAIDESGSMGKETFGKQLDFIGQVVKAVAERARNDKVGLTPYLSLIHI